MPAITMVAEWVAELSKSAAWLPPRCCVTMLQFWAITKLVLLAEPETMCAVQLPVSWFVSYSCSHKHKHTHAGGERLLRR